MNLLFYQATRYCSISPLKQGSRRRQTHNLNSAKRFILFFRYFSPDGLLKYIRACRRGSASDVNYLVSFLQTTGNDWSTRIFSDFFAMNHLINVMNNVAGHTTLDNIINSSFGWSGTLDGSSYWSTLHHLLGPFLHFLQVNNVDINEPVASLDETLYPALRNNAEFAAHVVARPTTVVNELESILNNANSSDTQDEIEIRVEDGFNTYSYLGPSGVRINFRMPTESFTTSGSSSETHWIDGTI